MLTSIYKFIYRKSVTGGGHKYIHIPFVLLFKITQVLCRPHSQCRNQMCGWAGPIEINELIWIIIPAVGTVAHVQRGQFEGKRANLGSGWAILANFR